MTLISRVLGLLRDVAIAFTFPVSGATDAFFVAFRIPNLLRRLFAEGSFSLAFVPVLSQYKETRSREDLQDLIDHVAGMLSLLLFIITVIGVIAAPLLISLFAPWFGEGDDRHALATGMLRITFPYILFISLTALSGGILNTFSRFAIPAFTPVLLNLTLIAAALWLAPLMDEPVTALAWGVLIAGIAQLAFQLPFLQRLGLLPRLRLQKAHEGVRQILKLMLPALFGSSVAQLNLLINTIVASSLMVGSISWLYFSDRFVELPLALFGVAIGTAILPKLAREHARAAGNTFNHTLDWAMRLAIVISIPAMLGLVLLAEPILATVIQYGKFTLRDVHMAGMSLMAYAAGLPAFILVKVLAPGFYSRKNTRTPVKIGIIAVFINIVLTILIVVPWLYFGITGPHAGLALATALAGYCNAGMLYLMLRRQGIYAPLAGWKRLWLQVAVSALLMVAALILLRPPLDFWSGADLWQRVGMLTWLICAGGISYAVGLAVLGVRPSHFSAH